MPEIYGVKQIGSKWVIYDTRTGTELEAYDDEGEARRIRRAMHDRHSDVREKEKRQGKL